jgi:hypothetical protein
MATRMQQRRGTAAEWTAADPVLAAAEFGYETDTGKFKIGDGVNAWSTLQAFSDASSILGAAPDTLDTLAELAASIDNNPAFYEDVAANATAIAQLSSDTAAAHATYEAQFVTAAANAEAFATTAVGDAILIELTARQSADTTLSTDLATVGSTLSDLATTVTLGDTTLQDNLDAEETARLLAEGTLTLNLTSEETARIAADDANSAAIAAETTARTAADTAHFTSTTSVHGIADTSVLATNTDVSNAQTSAENYADSLAVNYDATGLAAAAQTAAQSFATTEVSDHNLVTTNIHGIADTSLLVTTGGATFTGDVVLNADPSQALGAVTKQYADSISQGLHVHASVTALSTSNVDVTGSTPTTVIDGVTLVDGARVILNGQTDSADNGIYVFTATGSTFTRSSDFDEPGEIAGGDFLFVTGGTVYSDTGWVQTSDQPATIGTDPIVFTQFSGAGSITAGTNVEVTGTQVSLVADPTLSDATITNLDITNLVFADGTQTGAGVLSITPIAQKVASYELAASSEKDTLIEVDSVSATTVTIPAEASVNFPVGSTLDIIQVGTGQVTIAGASGVTVNSTPGLKLRAQWSSVTLLKRGSDSWIVFGDTSA